MKKVFVTGVARGIGKRLALRLAGQVEVLGVDFLHWEGHPDTIRTAQVEPGKRKLEELFRKERPDTVVHCGLIQDFRGSDERRHDVNVRGTKQLLDLCAQFPPKRLLLLSTGMVYGAFPENPYPMTEDLPLSASRSVVEMRDLVEADALVMEFRWRVPGVRTAVLRPVHVLGPTCQTAIAQYLRLLPVPTVLGFDPMLQFIHEEDLLDAVLLSLETELQGAFNVTGPGAVPLQTAIREVGSPQLPVIEPMMRAVVSGLSRIPTIPFPAGAIDYLKYPMILSGELFEKETGFRCLYDLEETFHSVVQA